MSGQSSLKRLASACVLFDFVAATLLADKTKALGKAREEREIHYRDEMATGRSSRIKIYT